jgi:PAS domain S-box-containing protein
MSNNRRLDAEELAIRLAALVDSSEDAIISKDLDGTITTWNAAACRLFGYRAEEIVGQSVLLITPPELYDQESANLRRIENGERVDHLLTQRLRKGGGRVDVSATMAPIYGPDGKVIGASLVARDFARTRTTDHAQARLAAIVESSDDAIISKDLNSIITSWNIGATRMFGYTSEEMVGRSIMVLIPPDLQHEEAEIIDKLKRGERIDHFETTRVKKGGERFDVSLTISPIRDATGKVVGASKIARDISDRRRTDETRMRLAAIVESSDDGIIGKDLDGIITSWNSGASRIFGYKADEIIGYSVLKLIPRELHSEEPMILARLRAGNRIEHYESRRVRKDGEIIDVSLTISPIRDGSGKVIGASKIVRDITSRKRAEAALLEKEKLAATGRMAATLAHEVNNPLESIMNLAFLLAKDASLTPMARGYAEMLLQEVQRASEITKQTLSFYRTSASAGEVHVSTMLETILSTKRKKLNEKEVLLRVHVEGSGKAWGFAGELGQVFSNLVENAIDAVPRGGEIRIRTRDLKQALCVTVCDNGTGMSRATMEHIFEPFYTTKGHKGSGLGLWVSRGIIHKHGGNIRVRSKQGPQKHGTVFVVTLPRQPDQVPNGPPVLKDYTAA